MLFDLARDAWGLFAAKRKRDNRDFISATVTASDSSTRYGNLGKTESSSLVARAQQTMLICAERNARTCAMQTLRLYVPSRPGGKGRDWARKVKTRNALANAKSVRWADTADEVDEVMDHPVLTLLNQPNPFMSSMFFFQYLFQSAELTGNHYTHLVEPTTGSVSELWPMLPQNTWVMPDQKDFISGYGYGRDGSIEDTFAVDEVMHGKHAPHPNYPYVGMGPAHAVVAEMDMESASTTCELEMWRNGARPDWAIAVPPETTQEQMKALEAQLKTFKGPRGRSKYLITTLSEIKPLQFSNKDMERIASLEDVRRTIYAAYGIPESEMRMNDANLASSVTGSAQYMRVTIEPRIRAMADLLTSYLLPKFNITPGEMWFAYDPCVPQDQAATTTRMVSLVGSRILTPNEARQEIGYPPMDGGDQWQDPYAPMGANAAAGVNQNAVNNDGGPDGSAGDASQQQAPAPTGSEGVVVSERLSGIDAERAANLLRQVSTGEQSPEVVTGILLAMGIPADTVQSMVAAADAFVPEPPPEQQVPADAPPPVQDAPSSAADRGVKAYAEWRDLHHKDEYAPNVSDDQIDAVSKMAEAVKDVFWHQPVDVRGDIVFTPGLDAALAEAIRPHARRFLSAGISVGVDTLKASGMASAFTVEPVRALEFLNTYTIRLSRGITETTQADLKAQLAAGATEGENLAQLNARVANALKESSGWRAERIARTETTRMFSEGSRLAYRDNGITKMRFILSAEPCEQCVEVARTYSGEHSIDTDEMVPPVHPQCRCAIAPVVDLGDSDET